jgi:plasmid stabilization system protein ParE
MYVRPSSTRFATKPCPVSGSWARQTIEGVRKLVTRKYPYLVYYTVDPSAEEIIILTIQHPAREREHEDA